MYLTLYDLKFVHLFDINVMVKENFIIHSSTKKLRPFLFFVCGSKIVKNDISENRFEMLNKNKIRCLTILIMLQALDLVICIFPMKSKGFYCA